MFSSKTPLAHGTLRRDFSSSVALTTKNSVGDCKNSRFITKVGVAVRKDACDTNGAVTINDAATVTDNFYPKILKLIVKNAAIRKNSAPFSLHLSDAAKLNSWKAILKHRRCSTSDFICRDAFAFTFCSIITYHSNCEKEQNCGHPFHHNVQAGI